MAVDSSVFSSLSTHIADVVNAAAPSVVQVAGRRRPASGIIVRPDVVLTTARALGREDGLHVRTSDGRLLDAELGGWDPTTSLAVLRVSGLEGRPLVRAEAPARVGNFAVAIARSWSNAVTASFGIVSVIGGPLATGRGRAIDEVIRTTAPMHEGFSGGAVLDPAGRVVGVATAARIRGLGVVIPASIAWTTAETLASQGGAKRGYLGIAGQPVDVPARQRGDDNPARALLVMSVTGGSPADTAGLIVGDIVVAFDGHAVESPEDLLELLVGDRVGREVTIRILRGGVSRDVAVIVGERPRG